MNDAARIREFDKALDTVANLYSVLGDAGGNAEHIIHCYMDRPLREFLSHVAAPNYIRFQYKPDAHNVHKD